MRVDSVSQVGNNSQVNFQGKVDKSVKSCLNNFYEHYRREKISEVINKKVPANFEDLEQYKVEIKDTTKRLNSFMKKCHDKSILKFDLGSVVSTKDKKRTPAKLFVENSLLPKGFVKEYATSDEFINYRGYEGNGLKELKALLRITNEFLENNTPKKCDKNLLESALDNVASKANNSVSKNQRKSVRNNISRIETFKDEINYNQDKFDKYREVIIKSLKSDKKSS